MSDEHETAVDVAGMATILAISREKVYRMAQRGEIPAIKVGREWRFFPSKVITKLEAPADPWRQSPQSRARKRVV